MMRKIVSDGGLNRSLQNLRRRRALLDGAIAVLSRYQELAESVSGERMHRHSRSSVPSVIRRMRAKR